VKSRSIVLASRNKGKVREIEAVLAPLGVRVKSLDDYPDITEPAEEGETFAQNARDKAIYYAKATGQWCLADDSGLEVDALDGAPGVYSARWSTDQCDENAPREVITNANNERLLRELAETPDEKRTARFVCHLALAEDERVIIETFDTLEGTIANQLRGKNGFGYDPLFFLPQRSCTAAELTAQEKNEISHRGKAVRHFAKLLGSFLTAQQNK